MKESAPVYQSPFKKPPFPQLKSAYAKAARDANASSPQARLKDWTQVKPSNNGMSSQRAKVTLLLPESGGSFQI